MSNLSVMDDEMPSPEICDEWLRRHREPATVGDRLWLPLPEPPPATQRVPEPRNEPIVIDMA